MIDRHVGRANPPFIPVSNPEKFISLIKNHGVLSRVMQARTCPCIKDSGSPSMYCTLCRGDGIIYSFQRKLLQEDEDSERSWDGATVNPFRVPIIQPLKVETMREPERGGIEQYIIDSFNDTEIAISVNQTLYQSPALPKHFEKMRVSYYFDRYNHVEDEIATVDAATSTLTMPGTRWDDGHRTGNVKNVSGDITIVERVHSIANDHDYTNFWFRKNQIYVTVGVGEPPLVQDDIIVSYYYCPCTLTLPAELLTRLDKSLNFAADLTSGTVRIAFEPWYEIGQGDIITFLSATLYTNELLRHNEDLDKLREFDINTIVDDIVDEDGVYYRQGVDFQLKNFRDIHWLAGGNQPDSQKRISVRYGYRPTFIVFEENPQPSSLENKQYPPLVTAKLWSKTLNKDIQQMANPLYA